MTFKVEGQLPMVPDGQQDDRRPIDQGVEQQVVLEDVLAQCVALLVQSRQFCAKLCQRVGGLEI